MAIQALPPSTTRILGSAQALTTPLSLIKELVDNAIDARATSIEIVISPNTLDKIEVRDNGHGIAPEDLDALGRRGHTSKLRTFEELKAVGRSSLGFRGEALASAVTLGEVTVTTRTEGEAVAAVVKLAKCGGVAEQSSASHPTGTTISVKNFLAPLPVRKQTLLKESTRSLAQIRELLQAYALARVTVRLNLKVQKGGKGSWAYAPRPQDGLREAVIKAIGQELGSQCILVNGPVQVTSGLTDPSRRAVSPSFTIQAFLPGPKADLSKVKGGQFVSVDGRPLSISRGHMKQIISSFKRSIKDFAKAAKQDAPKDPFLCLKFTSTSDCYDANIEPAKDDIVFEDGDAVTYAVNHVFRQTYAQTVEQISASRPSVIPEVIRPAESALTSDGTQQETAVHMLFDAEDNLQLASDSVTETLIEYGAESTLADDETRLAADDDDDDERPLNILNPWLIAKMNAPAAKPMQAHISAHTPCRNRIGSAIHTPASTIRPTVKPAVSGFAHSSPLARGDERGDGDIGTWVGQHPRRSKSVEMDIHSVSDGDEAALEVPVGRIATLPGFVSARKLRDDVAPSGFYDHENTGTADVEIMSTRPGHKSHMRTFKSVMRNRAQYSPPSSGGITHAGYASQASAPFIQPRREQPNTQPSFGNNSFQPVHRRFLGPPAELPPGPNGARIADNVYTAMDFEHRKAAATQHLRDTLRSSARLHSPAATTTRDSPTSTFGDAYDNAKFYERGATVEQEQGAVAEEQNTMSSSNLKTIFGPGDPRAYLIRRQKSISATAANPSLKVKRTKTSLLPLETIPETAALHHLLLKVTLDLNSISSTMQTLSSIDTYTKMGERLEGYKMCTEEQAAVEPALNALMKAHEAKSQVPVEA